MSYRFASLSSGLLARKGAAQPAMATHAGGNLARPREEITYAAPPRGDQFAPAALLARAGFTSSPPPMPSPPAERSVPAMQAGRQPLTGGGCATSAACAVADMAPADPARRFHISVRLRQAHFVRLKIAAAQLRKPSQEIVGEALSMYFRTLDPNLFGDCSCARE